MTPIEERLLASSQKGCEPAFPISDVALLDIQKVAHDTHGYRAIYPGSTVIASQVRLWGWRADFLVSRLPRLGAPRVEVFIECDGHDYHERTKEQARRDRSRDRRLQLVAPILRFTGQELWEDADGCWSEVVGFLDQLEKVRLSERVMARQELLCRLATEDNGLSAHVQSAIIDAVYGFQIKPLPQNEVGDISDWSSLSWLKKIVRISIGTDGLYRFRPAINAEADL